MREERREKREERREKREERREIEGGEEEEDDYCFE